ncbi:MAG: hypothetical protein IKH13_09425 [Clostridia bacterium]|nr:hypothetical protein [Clostridia bacterium]
MKHKRFFKRIFCFLLSIITVFLFVSCSKKEGGEAAQTETTVPEITTVELRDKVKADGFLPEMLPETFPESLPAGITCKSQAKYFADEETYGYKVDFFRLRLSGDSTSFYSLDTLLRGKGWIGGCAVYTPEDEEKSGEDETNTIQGYWSDRKYICQISESDYDEDNQQYTISRDIYEDYFEFPEEVAKYFPVFNAPNIGSGKLSVFTKNGREVKDYGSIDSYKWRYDCNGEAFFAGVDFYMFDEYVSALEKEGFVLSEKEGSNDHGDYCTIEAKKVIGGKTYYAYFFYVDYLKTVSCAYLNDLDFFNKYNI